MNLLKRNPFTVLQLIFAFITLAVVFTSVYFFAHDDLERLFMKKVINKSEEEVTSEDLYSRFGVIHVALEAPSYAQSDFDISPTTKIALYFNEKVDIESAFSHISLVNAETNQEVSYKGASLDRSDDFSGDYLWKWQELWKQQIIITPEEALSPKTKYVVTALNGIKSQDEKMATSTNFQSTFNTADSPGVQSVSLEDGILRVMFKAPMDSVELQDKVTITPEVDTSIFKNNDKVLIIEGEFSVGVTYDITIPGDTQDIYGRIMGEDYTTSLIAK